MNIDCYIFSRKNVNLHNFNVSQIFLFLTITIQYNNILDLSPLEQFSNFRFLHYIFIKDFLFLNYQMLEQVFVSSRTHQHNFYCAENGIRISERSFFYFWVSPHTVRTFQCLYAAQIYSLFLDFRKLFCHQIPQKFILIYL